MPEDEIQEEVTEQDDGQDREPVDLNEEQYGLVVKRYRRYREAQEETNRIVQEAQENLQKEASATEDLLVALGGSDYEIEVSAEGDITLYSRAG